MGVTAGVPPIVLSDNLRHTGRACRCSNITSSELRNYLKFLFIKSSRDFRLQNCINNINLNLVIKNDSNLST